MVLPVPVASVSRMRCLSSAMASSTRSMAMSWKYRSPKVPPLSSNGTAANRSRQAFAFGKSHVPEFVRRGVARQFAFLAGLHVDAVDALAVGGIGVADGQFPGVIFRLRYAFGQFFIPRLGLDDGQLGVAIDQNVVGR